MNQLTESLPPAPEPSTVEFAPVQPSTVRAPYVAPQLITHHSWVMTTGVSTPLEGNALLSELPGRSS